MTRIITTIHLSDIQKEVLCKVQASPNEQVAWETITKTANAIDNNFIAARDALGNLGLLEVGDGTLVITEKGNNVMMDEYLIDEMGELTEEGQELASKDRSENPEPKEPPVQQPQGDELGGEMDVPMESLSLLKTLNEGAAILSEVNRLNAKS